MTDSPITWTGEPDDQRAEWRGMVACVKPSCTHDGTWYCAVWTCDDTRTLFHSADCMLWPEHQVAAKNICELVMRHEAAKADMAQRDADVEALERVYSAAREYRDYIQGDKLESYGGTFRREKLFRAVNEIANKDGGQ
jgi:hypothetical protein